MRETRVRSLGREDPWRRKWHPTPVSLPRESHGRRSLEGYSPWRVSKSRTRLSDFTSLHSTDFTIPTVLFPWKWKHFILTQHSDFLTISFMLSFSEKQLFIFNWRIIALQYPVGFCHISTWISHGITHGLVAKSCPTLATPWTVAHQAPLSMGILQARSGLSFPFPEDLPNQKFFPGFKLRNRTQVSCIAGRFSTDWATGKPTYQHESAIGIYACPLPLKPPPLPTPHPNPPSRLS